MARSPGKRPDARALPPDHKQPRTLRSGGPALHDRETIVWAFSIVDQDGPWGWRTAAAPAWWGEILPKLQDFESMTWSEIMKAAGGRARGNNSHFVQVERLTKQAKQRLAEISQDDVSELFSLRLVRSASRHEHASGVPGSESLARDSALAIPTCPEDQRRGRLGDLTAR